MRIQVRMFAALKDHFDASFELDLEEPCRVEDLFVRLQAMRPDAAKTLAACRFALADELVDKNRPLAANDEISVLPPSSGG